MSVRTLTLVPETIVQSPSGTAWSNIERARNRDGAFAAVLLAPAASSQTIALNYLQAPELEQVAGTVTIVGVSVSIWRFSYTASAIQDLVIRQCDGTGGSAFGNNLADVSGHWPQITYDPGNLVPVEAVYGSSLAKWGVLPTLADLRARNYGLLIQVQNTAGGSANGYIDAILPTLLIDVAEAVIIATNPTPSGALVDPTLADVSTTVDLALAKTLRRGKNPSALVFAMGLTYYDRLAAALSTLYAANAWAPSAYRTGPTDTPANAVFLRDIQALELRQTLLAPQALLAGDLAYDGQAVLANDDYLYDALLPTKAYVANYPFSLRFGLDDRKYADLGLLFDGAVQSVEHQLVAGTATVKFQGAYRLLNASVAPLRESGATNSALTDAVSPFAAGFNANVRPLAVSTTKVRMQSDLPLSAVSKVRVAGIADASGTVDLIAGTVTFGSPRSGEVTADIAGARARNRMKNSRRMTQVGWTPSNLTPTDLSPGLGGSGTGTRVTVTGSSAKATYTLLESPSGEPYAVISAMLRRVSGSGQFAIANGTVVTIGSIVARPYRIIANPAGTGTELDFNFPGGAGDVFDWDWGMHEPAAVNPSWPIESGSSVGTWYPDTAAEIIKLLLMRAKVLPLSFGCNMASFDRLASQASAGLGIYIEDGASVVQVLRLILDSVLGYLTIDRDGLVKVGQIGFAEDGQVATLTERRHITDAAIVARSTPSAVRVLFYPNAHVQPASGDNPEISGRAYQARFGSSDTLAAAVGDGAEQVMEVVTALTDGTDATALVDRILQLFGPDTLLVRLNCTAAGMAVWQGDTIAFSIAPITHGRHDRPRTRRGLVLSRAIQVGEQGLTVELLVLS